MGKKQSNKTAKVVSKPKPDKALMPFLEAIVRAKDEDDFCKAAEIWKQTSLNVILVSIQIFDNPLEDLSGELGQSVAPRITGLLYALPRLFQALPQLLNNKVYDACQQMELLCDLFERIVSWHYPNGLISQYRTAAADACVAVTKSTKLFCREIKRPKTACIAVNNSNAPLPQEAVEIMKKLESLEFGETLTAKEIRARTGLANDDRQIRRWIQMVKPYGIKSCNKGYYADKVKKNEVS